MTTYSDQVFQLGGVPVSGPMILQTGKAIFVRPSTGLDGNTGASPSKAVKTLARALSKATANNGDVVYLIAESNTAGSTTDYQSVTLDWNKDGVHLIGINNGTQLNQRSRIAQLSSAAAVGSLVKLSANNCLIANLEIFQGVADTTDTAPIALEVTGQRNCLQNCTISGIGHVDLDVAGGMSLKVSGAENLFQHCYIGLDTILRATAVNEVSLANARNVLEHCTVASWTSSSTFKAVTVVQSTVGRSVTLDNCLLTAVQNITSAVAPTGAIIHGSSVDGNTFFHHSAVYGYADTSTLADTRILISAVAGSVADIGLATGANN